MSLKRNFVICIIICLVEINSFIVQDPNYSPDYFFSTNDRNNYRPNFLDKRRRNNISARRVKLLDEYLSNSSVFVDGILHYTINENHKHLKQLSAIEKAYKDLIAMKGVTYTYKRDQFWRTWRRVEYLNGDIRIVCYRCQGSVNCTSCRNGGYWVIEENPPPCPYEIISIINSGELRAMNLTNPTNENETVVSFNDVTSTCDNPIYTKWRIHRVYDKTVSERFPEIICGARDYCELSTIYTITRDYVSFRIINSTNHIVYSRVMKNGKMNYACVHECGQIDPATNVVSKTDGPLTVDMITKNKRHDKIASTDSYKTSTAWTSEGYNLLNNEQFKQAYNSMEKMFNFQIEPKTSHQHHHHLKHLTCSSLKHLENSDGE